MKVLERVLSKDDSRYAGQAVFLYGATLFGVLLGILSSVVNTRFLAPVEYGDVRYVQNIINYVAAFLFVGYFLAGSRLLALSGSEEKARTVRGALVSILGICSVILIFGVAILGAVYSGKPLAKLFFLSIPVCLQPLLLNYCTFVLPGDNHIWRLSLTKFMPALLYVPVAYFVFKGTGASSAKMILLQWGLASLLFIGVIISTRPTFKGMRPVFSDLKRENKEYGRELYFSSLIVVATNNLAGVTIGLFNPDNTMVGFYTLALTVTYPLATLPAIVGTTFFKKLASQPRIPGKVLGLTVAATAVTGLLFVLLIKPLVVFLYTDEYIRVGTFAQWMALSFCLHGLGDMFNRYLASHGLGKEVRNSSIACGAVKLVGFTLFVWLWNTTGALIALTVSEAVYAFALWGYYLKFVKKNANE